MIPQNPNAFRFASGDLPKAHFRVEMLKLDPYTKVERWICLAKCGDRKKAEQMAADGFGGGVKVRVVDGA